jgi:hypothetical protein
MGKKKLTLAEQIDLLDLEIQWCYNHPDATLPEKFRKGFIAGLIQAKYLLTELASPQTECLHDGAWTVSLDPHDRHPTDLTCRRCGVTWKVGE